MECIMRGFGIEFTLCLRGWLKPRLLLLCSAVNITVW